MSVEAINAGELKVTFNRTVSKDSLAGTDFTVTLTGTSTSANVTDVQLSKDGKSAILLLDTAIPAAGVDIKVAEGDILTASFEKFAKFSTTAVKAAEDTTAPKLLSATTDGSDVELTFDEPVKFTNSTVKVNQVTVTNPTASTTAGEYVYTVSASNIKAGSNNLEITNIEDLAGNKETLISTSVEYAADTTAPKVAGITADGQKSFIVEFSKPVGTLTAANFVITKGNLALDSSYFDSFTPVDADGNTVVSSKYVRVTLKDSATNTANPLYSTGESAVNLSVKVTGYKDTQTTPVLGSDYTASVTLSTDTTAPVVTSEKLIKDGTTTVSSTNYDTIIVPFNETLSAADASAITVKAGSVKVAVSSADVNGKNLEIRLASGTITTGTTYNVTLGAGAVKDSANNKNAATSVSYTKAAASSTYNNAVAGAGAVVNTTTATKNVITVSYGSKVNDAAATASTYKLNGSSLPTGTDVYFTSAAKDTVEIVLPSSYEVNTQDKLAKLTIAADTVKYDATGYYASASTTESKAIDSVITLNDNVAPKVTKVEYVKDSNGLATGLKVTFSEAVNDSTIGSTFVVKQGSTTVTAPVANPTADVVNDNVIYLSFEDGSSNAIALSPSNVTLSTSTTAANVTLADAKGNVIGAFTAIAAQ